MAVINGGAAAGSPGRGLVPRRVRAFGQAAELVSEWRLLRAGAATGTKVEHARAEERRWKLEVAMIADFGFTLPSEVEPLNESRRDDHLGWRWNALRQARKRVRQGQAADAPAAGATTEPVAEVGTERVGMGFTFVG